MSSTREDVIGGISASTAVKAPVRCATTANITLSGFQDLDGVTLAEDDENLRVLVKDQTDTTENGIYDASSSSWSRAVDFDGNRDARKGTVVNVNEGTLYAGTSWRCTTADPIVFDTSNITFENLQVVTVGTAIHSSTAKTTPVDADTMPIIDSAASNVLKKVTWANIKATLKAYFDTLYQPLSAVLTATTASFLTADETKLDGIEALADVTDAGNVGSSIHGATAKTTLADNDEFSIIDSAASNVLKRILWSNVRAAIAAAMAALQADQETGTSTVLFVTPGRQHFNPCSSKFWLKAGDAGNILASYNITSLADTGTGDVAVTIANDISGVHYAVVTGGERTSSTGTATLARDISIKTGTLTAGVFSLECWDSTATTNVIKDPASWHCAGFGDL